MTVIIGEAPTYEPEGTGIETEAGETVNIGTTQKEPYSVRVGNSDIFIRASSQEELDNFLAWLSLKSGKPVEELTALDFNRFVPPSLLSASESVTDPDNPGLVTVFGIEGQQWGSVEGFNDTEFFGDEIPSFPPGSGSFNGYNIKTGEGMKTSVGLYGFAGTAQMIYKANYPAGEELPLIDTEKVNPEVLALHKRMFGDVPMTQGHLNVLKMMGLVSGSAKTGSDRWAVTDTGKSISAEIDRSETDFIPAATLLSLDGTDLATAAEVKGYFSPDGRLINGFTTQDLEGLAGGLIESMTPADTALPPGVQIDPKSQTMLNNLYGLPANNTEFTAEQVNSAIAMGLVKFDPATGKVTLTTNGQGYLDTKIAEGEKPEEGNPDDAGSDSNLINDHYDTLMVDVAGDEENGTRKGDGRGDGWQMADYMESQFPDSNGVTGDGDNSNIGRNGIRLLSGLDVHSAHWEDAGLGHLSIPERQKLIDAAKAIVDHPDYDSSWNAMSEGNRVEGAVHENNVREWLSANSYSTLADDKRAKAMLDDTAVTTPSDADANSIQPDQISTEDRTVLNRLMAKLFGESYDAMSPEKQRKALWILSSLGYITSTSQTEIDTNAGGYGGRTSQSSGESTTTTDIDLTDKGDKVLKPKPEKA